MCTCYRLVKTSILKSLKINGERFEYDFSMINQLAKKNQKYWSLFRLIIRTDPLKKVKKNTWIVGIYALKRIIPDRFTS